MLALVFLISWYCYPGPYESYTEINVNPTGKELQDLKWNQVQASLVLCQINDLWSFKVVLRDYKLIPKDYLLCWVKGRTEIEGRGCRELFSINWFMQKDSFPKPSELLPSFWEGKCWLSFHKLKMFSNKWSNWNLPKIIYLKMQVQISGY